MKMLKKMAALLLAGVMALALLTAFAAMTAHLLFSHRRLKMQLWCYEAGHRYSGK